MFKKTIKYENFEGEERTKEFYFHLGKAELLEFVAEGAFEQRLERMIAAKDNLAILKEFQRIVAMAIGVRSEDGETFIKNDKVRQELMSSPAYDELLLELVTDADKGTEFIKNLLPPKMQKQLGQELLKQVTLLPVAKHLSDQAPEDNRPAWIRENREPTKAELTSMTKEQVQELYSRKMQNLRSGDEGFTTQISE